VAGVDDLLKRELLNTLNSNGNIYYLKERFKISFSTVMSSLKKLHIEGLIDINDKNGFTLTEAGAAFLGGGQTTNAKRWEPWLNPKKEFWGKPVNINSVYLPKRIKDLGGSNS
jgi:predicted transcriptional regulator